MQWDGDMVATASTTVPAGLTRAEAAARLDREGPNALPPPPRRSAARELLAQVTHFFALMLWAAALLALVAGLPELAVAIVVVIAFNAVFAFAQEHRAERAADRLRDLVPRRVTVIRDGVPSQIPAAELVVGDVVVLAAGDRVPADLDCTSTHDVWVDTSTLTGESVPSPAVAGDTVYAGTFVTQGEAMGVVQATGAHTRLGSLARLTQEGRRPAAPLALELRRVVRTIAVIAVGVGIAAFAVFVALGTPPTDGFIFAVGVTVALVPEGLLPTVSLSLAVGAQRMARRHALVRRLEAVQTLGSTTFVCTDKTGTLTRNEMAVVEVWTPSGWARIHGNGYEPDATLDVDGPATVPALRHAAAAALRCSNGRAVQRGGRWVAEGDPMEAALDALSQRVRADPAALGPECTRFPFDPVRRRMSVVTSEAVLVKGAPDTVLPLCAPDADAEAAVARMTTSGLRVIAVAVAPAGHSPTTAADAERDATVVGILGLEDPPRPGAAEAVAACRRAGIHLAMVTGDHPATAEAIALEVGLLGVDRTVVTGAQLPADEAALGALLDRDGIVVARVSPEDKLRIATALRARGHVVAMTGDGVNDGPALRAADIGIAMGRSGTDVAREAADLVLLDDDFATIVAAVEQGRATFANVRRFLTYHLTDNVAELTPFLAWAASGGRFPLALTVLQILALDIGTDSFEAVALGAEAPARHVLDQPPIRGRLLNRTVARRAFAVLGPVEAAFGMAAFVGTFLAYGWRPGAPFPAGTALATASGATFTTVVLVQAVNAFACRSSTLRPGQLGWLSNRLLLGAIAIDCSIAASFLVVSPLARLLRHAPPLAVGWFIGVAGMVALLAADAADKWWSARDRESKSSHRRRRPGSTQLAGRQV